MTWTQIISIAACAVLGYWLVAVFIPLIGKGKENYSEGQDADGSPAADETEGQGQHRQSTLKRWFEVLDVSEHSSAAEIAAAYRQKISQYHPDRVAKMGPDIRELAEQRSIEINLAYEAAMKPRAGKSVS